MKDKGETAFGAVILAAGLSSRMGAFKPLLTWEACLPPKGS